MMEFKEKVKELRRKKGWVQEDLAREIEVSLSELMEMAKMESLGFKMTFELLDIRPLLQNKVSEFLPVASEKRQSLTLDMPHSVPMVRADRQRLEQILLNLLT